MREITEKYRCWDIMEEKMKPVKALYFGWCDEEGMQGEEISVLTGEPYIDEDMKKWKNVLTARPDLDNSVPSTASCILLRYTGLKDKNGKEIYEGDITSDKQVVVFDVLFCRFGIANYDIKARPEWVWAYGFNPDNIKDLEIVGNIYGNPELLTKIKEKNNE